MDKSTVKITAGYVYKGHKSAKLDDDSDNIELLEKLDALIPQLQEVINSGFGSRRIEKATIQNSEWGINNYSWRPVFGGQYQVTASNEEVEEIKARINNSFESLQKESGDELLDNIFTSFGVVKGDEDKQI